MADTEADTFATFEDALAVMPEAHIQCRDYGHSWRRHTARYLQDQRLYERVLRCTRCRTLRSQLIGQHGERIGSSYSYARHYLMKGVGRLDEDARATLRLASVQHDMQRVN